jgi:dipeptide/tripeptide permease
MMIFSTLGSCTSNLVTFGANQIENNPEQLKFYFSLQMICIKLGGLIGRFFTPVLREDVKCFGSDSCYPLAFAVPTLSILVATILMISGKSFFKMVPPSGNLFLNVCGCILYGIRGKFMQCKEKKSHWLEHSTEKFGRKLVSDTKIILGTFTIFLPTAIYWAVFMQQGSRWIFQATRMNGDLGWYTLKPDQMIAFNSVFVILLIPVCNYIFYPFLNLIGIKSLLHKITIGGFLCCISFLMSAYVETKIDKNYISILWLLPQFAILALSENFVYISLINFAFSETPDGMKSVMTAFVFLIIAMGNFLITLVSGFHLFNTQFYEFLFFAGILFIDMLIFLGLSMKYTYAKDRKLLDAEV